MTRKSYLSSPSLSGAMEIAGIKQGDRIIVQAVETWFHPQGGGQKGDRGRLGPAEVLDVRHGPDGVVDHIVDSADGLMVGQSYPFEIDRDWRGLNARFHTAGHLLAGLCEHLFLGVQAVSGHQWPGEARVEFTGEGLEAVIADLPRLERALAAWIAKDVAVKIVGDPESDRRIAIGDLAPVPCGGTHVESLGPLGAVQLRSTKIKGGSLRIGYDLR